MPRPHEPASPFRYFNSSPEVIRLVVMMYAKYPLSHRHIEDLLFERGIADREGGILESYITRTRDKDAAVSLAR